MIPWIHERWPLSWPDVFGREAPLVIEIGFGNGVFLTQLAAARPESSVLGIERSAKMARQVDKKLGRTACPNLRLIQGDAHLLLEHLFEPHRIAEVYINFPDPWFKKHHRGRRLIRADFIELLSRRMAAGGRLSIATDHAELGDWIAEVLEAQPFFRPVHATPWIDFDDDRVATTHYEGKARRAGTPIRYFTWHHAAPAEDRPCADGMDVMPNVSLDGPLDLARFFQGFELGAMQPADATTVVVIAFHRVFQALNGDEWIVETTVREGRLQQVFGVLVVRRDDGRHLVKAARLGSPRPTWGVKRAVREVAQRLVAAHPGLGVVETTVGPIAAP